MKKKATEHTNNRASKHAHAIDFPHLLPRGAGQEKLANQLLQVAMRSPDRWIEPKEKKKKKKKNIVAEKKKKLDMSQFDEKDEDSEDETIDDVAEMRKTAKLKQDSQNEALIAQITNAKRAQELFEIERKKARATKDRQEELANMKRQKQEEYDAYVHRTHAAMYYYAGRGDLTKLSDMWETVDRTLLLSLLDRCIDEDNKDTILLWAAENGKVAVIQWCADRGCDVFARDAHGRTAVLKASWRGHIGTVKYLIDEYNFSPRLQKNSYGDTMMHDASYSGRVDLFAWLHRTYTLDLESVNELGEVPFHGACACGNVELCQYMLERNVDPGRLGYDSRNAAHYACVGGFIDTLNLLHQHCPEVDFTAVDRLGRNVFWIATHENRDEAQARKTVSALKKMCPKEFVEQENMKLIGQSDEND
jgi:ankyrin repeat protein